MPKKITGAQRMIARQLVYSRRIAGHSVRAIAEQLGISTNNVLTLFREADELLVRQCEHELAEMRRLELERLDAIQLAIWDQATQGDYEAIDRVLKISERRAKVAGFEAAIRVKVEEAINQNLDEFLEAVRTALPQEYYQKILAIASEYTDRARCSTKSDM